MGFISDAVGGLLGSGADAAEGAAGAQGAAVQQAIDENRRAEEVARADLQPFTTAGKNQTRPTAKQLSSLHRDSSLLDRTSRGITGFVNSPDQQKQFITDNPFFAALADDAQSKLFNNQAARGKVGSGGTAEALQNSILLLGSDLVNQNISQRLAALQGERSAFDARSIATGQRQGAVNAGAGAAAGQAQATLNTANNISDLFTQGGNAEAAGIVGSQNAKTDAFGNLVNTGIGIAGLFGLSDRRAKTDIKKVGKTDGGHNVYTYKYKGSDKTQMGVMAQEVEKKRPDAVVTINNLKMVDYRKVH